MIYSNRLIKIVFFLIVANTNLLFAFSDDIITVDFVTQQLLIKHKIEYSDFHNQLLFKNKVLEEESEIILFNNMVRQKSLNSEQYDLSLDSNRLQWLSKIVDYKLHNPSRFLVFYPWEATGSLKLNDISLAIPSNNINKPLLESVYLNQRKPVSFIIQNLSDNAIKVLSISPDLKNINGVKFATKNIDVKIVKEWYMGSIASIYAQSYQLAHPIRVPELLVYDDQLIKTDDINKKNYLRINTNGKVIYQDVSSANILMPNDATADDALILQPFVIYSFNSKQIWFTIKTDNVTLPGKYIGFVNVQYLINDKLNVLKIPLTLEVINRKLGNSKLTYAIYYRGQIRDNFGFKSSQKSLKQYRLELQDIYNHGVMYPTQYINGDSESMIESYIQIRQQIGFPCDKYYFLGGIADASNEQLDFNKNITMLKNIIVQNTNCKNPQIYFYGKDEARDDELVKQLKIWDKIHQAGGKVFAASYKGTFSQVGINLDTLILSGKPNLDEISLFRKNQRDVFSYANPQAGVPNPQIYRNNYGVDLIVNGYTGAMDYAYQHMFPDINLIGDLSGGLCASSKVSYCSIWNNFDSGKYYDHVFAYPLTNSVVDTIQWEGFMEGVNDVKILQFE